MTIFSIENWCNLGCDKIIGIVLTSQTKIFFSCDNFAVDSFVLKISNIFRKYFSFKNSNFRLTLSLIRAQEPQGQHVVVQTFAMMLNMMALDIGLNDRTRQFLEIQMVVISMAFHPHNPCHYPYGHSFVLCTGLQNITISKFLLILTEWSVNPCFLVFQADSNLSLSNA